MASGGQIRQRAGGRGKKKTPKSQQQREQTGASTDRRSKRAAPAAAAASADRDARRRRALRIGAAISVGIVSVRSAWDWHRSSRAAAAAEEDVPPQLRNDSDWDRTDPKLDATDRFLSSFVCDHPDGYCHPNLRPVPGRRTHRTTGGAVEAGEVVLILPRSLQVWDLDALRDPFVRSDLLGAAHGRTGNPLDSGAYLAAYLLRRHRLALGAWADGADGGDGDGGERREKEGDDPLLPYLEILPTYDDLRLYHPTLWSTSEVTDLLGRYTPATVLVNAYREMMESEYEALSGASDEFRNNVDRDSYVAARVGVMSRSFGTGPPGPDEGRTSADGGLVLSLDDELEYYRRVAGIDLTVGCRAMSPVLDMWDSHPRPNAAWTYDPSRRAFVVRAAAGGKEGGGGGIPRGHDVMVSYGKYTEAHLFAKFGYVNGDGSSYSEASINSVHRLLDVGMMGQFSYLPSDGVGGRGESGRSPLDAQSNELVRYLQFDDGYEECIKPVLDGESDADAAWTLKGLKFQHLKAIANVRDRWVMRVAPRDPHSGPGVSSAVPITTRAPMFDHKTMRFDANKLVATCRLIELTNEDYGGEAVRVLTDVLNNGTAAAFLVGRQGDALEYRAVSCIVRLVNMMLWRYPSRVARDMKLLSSPAASGGGDGAEEEGEEETRPAFRSREWSAAHVRLGEMQSLEVLGGTMKVAGARMRERLEADPTISSASLVVRAKPCPIDDTLALLDLKTRMMGENYVKSTRTIEKVEVDS